MITSLLPPVLGKNALLAGACMPKVLAVNLLAKGLLAAGYRPFLDPLPFWNNSQWPWLLLPLTIGVAIVYKSIKCRSMKDVPREATVLTVTILASMAIAAALLALVVRGLEG